MQILVEWKRHKIRNNNNQASQTDTQPFGGDTRIVSAIGIIITAAIILFAWLFPAEKKDGGINLAMLFVGHMNIYILMPGITALKNENIRSYFEHRHSCLCQSNKSASQATIAPVISKNQVNPA